MNRNPNELKPHPKLKHFPMLTGDQYAALLRSIENKEILKPIVITSEDLVVDGRNRLKAALELGLDEVPVEVRDDVDPVLYAIETAATGRQLSKTALCMLLLEQHPDLSGKKAGRPKSDNCDSVTISKVAEQYQVPREYFGRILGCIDLCRNEFDRQRLDVLVYDMEVSATNLEKALLGWQASHPLGDQVSDEQIQNEPVPKRNEPNPVKLLDQSFRSITTQSCRWASISPTLRSRLRDRFLAMWNELPDELKKAVR